MTDTIIERPGIIRERVPLHGLWTVRKFWADDDLLRATPYEVIEAENALLTAGAQVLWERITANASPNALSSTNARLCVGNSGVATTAGMTDLQGASKTRKTVDAAAIISGATATFVATFTTTDANHDWLEAGIANSSSGATLINRVVQNFGTKTSSVQWVLTFAGTFATA